MNTLTAAVVLAVTLVSSAGAQEAAGALREAARFAGRDLPQPLPAVAPQPAPEGRPAAAQRAALGSSSLKLESKKSCEELHALGRYCVTQSASSFIRTIFGVGPSKIRFGRFNWLHAKVVEGDRTARVMFYPGERDYGFFGQEANLSIEVNDPKEFPANPYISRKMTYLYLFAFPEARCEVTREVAGRDQMGNVTSYSTRTFLRVTNAAGNPGLVKNFDSEIGYNGGTAAYTIPGLTYDAKGYVQCLVSGL